MWGKKYSGWDGYSRWGVAERRELSHVRELGGENDYHIKVVQYYARKGGSWGTEDWRGKKDEGGEQETVQQ